MPAFDPSQMDPKKLMELSKLVQQLPPEQLSRMQTLMHNMMAGFDVRKEMEEFERGLPPGFREKLMAVMGASGANPFAAAGPAYEPRPPSMAMASHPPTSSEVEPATLNREMSLREARVTLLRAVANGSITPEDAEKLLFPEA